MDGKAGRGEERRGEGGGRQNWKQWETTVTRFLRSNVFQADTHKNNSQNNTRIRKTETNQGKGDCPTLRGPLPHTRTPPQTPRRLDTREVTKTLPAILSPALAQPRSPIPPLKIPAGWKRRTQSVAKSGLEASLLLLLSVETFNMKPPPTL